jgi:hypothetical protein
MSTSPRARSRPLSAMFRNIPYGPVRHFEAYVRADLDKWRRVAREAHIVIE